MAFLLYAFLCAIFNCIHEKNRLLLLMIILLMIIIIIILPVLKRLNGQTLANTPVME